MSTFKGLFEEIPGIAVDRFDGECLQSKLLFLSHCHADHMVGLSTVDNLSVPLFTSEISAVFLRKQFPNVANAIETIEVDTPLELSYYVNGKVFSLIVTALSAKHCPGSVMFLFETGNQTVLYTGDFRIYKSQFDQYGLLKNKTIDCIYLDSTFLSNSYNEFPTQFESISVICSLIRKWLEIHPDNKILIEMPAQYGIEYLFIVIGRKLAEKIYVNPSQWQKYACLPAMDDCISPDMSKCRIFTKFKGTSGMNVIATKQFRIIKPSALYWANWKRGTPYMLQVGNRNEYRIAYSNHSSCLELKDFLEFAQPKRVQLNVVPDNYATGVKECLERIYTQAQKRSNVEHEEKDLDFDSIYLVSVASNEKTSALDVKFPPKRRKF